MISFILSNLLSFNFFMKKRIAGLKKEGQGSSARRASADHHHLAADKPLPPDSSISQSLESSELCGLSLLLISSRLSYSSS
jgi:hypothetical protein